MGNWKTLCTGDLKLKEKLVITNCDVITPFEEIKDANILIENGIIKEIISAGDFSKEGEIINANGRIAAPGFIDIHIQGAGGADVLDGTLEGLSTISKTCARFGVTGFLATTVARPEGDNRHLKTAANFTGKNLGGANLFGIHIEGPFISIDRKGMIKSDCICNPSEKILDEILKITEEKLQLMTIAPELEGSETIIKNLVNSDVVASFGHSKATYEETVKGIEAGISHVTHLFNVMPSIYHRDPGPIPAIFEEDKVTAQIIFDGIHIHPSVLNLATKILGEKRFITITDGMQAMGLPDGKYIYNGLEYHSINGISRYNDGTLIGTSLGMNQLVKRCIKLSGCSLTTAIRAASFNPASVLGIQEKKGSIEKGKDADIAILNRDFSVWKTIICSKVVYEE